MQPAARDGGHSAPGHGTNDGGLMLDMSAMKAADVVLWSGDPFSIYTKAELVFNDHPLIVGEPMPQPKPATDSQRIVA